MEARTAPQMAAVMAHASAVAQASDAPALFHHLGVAARGLGFAQFMLGLEIQRPGEDPLLHLVNDWPEPWSVPTWPEPSWPGPMSASPTHVAEARAPYDAGQALQVPVHSGRVTSVLSLAGGAPFNADPSLQQTIADGAVVLAHCAHVASTRVVVPELFRRLQPDLTERERKVLEYMVKGKSNSMIGDILGRSEATIEFHVRHIFDKMGVSNRLQAAIRAISLGLVDL